MERNQLCLLSNLCELYNVHVIKAYCICLIEVTHSQLSRSGVESIHTGQSLLTIIKT